MQKLTYALIVAAFATTGCATKDYVHEYVGGEMAPVKKRVDAVEGRTKAHEAGLETLNRRADGTEAALKAQGEQITAQGARIDAASQTAEEALNRAKLAGKLAEGKLMYEVVMSDDSLQFALEGAELSKAAQAQLDAFADKLKSENRNVFVEIQGHTDSTGDAGYNLKLSADRAEMVKRYLNMKGGIPLHRMSTIGYGEASPVADNKTRANRAKNRRVVLVVLH